jgi:hypothetical protein
MDVIGRAATLYRKRGLKQCFFISHPKSKSDNWLDLNSGKYDCVTSISPRTPYR